MNGSDVAARKFDGTDLSGAVFRDVDLSGASISGLISGLTINEVEVGPLISAELDRRYPERILLRSDEPDDLRHGWALVRAQWNATLDRIARLTPRLQRQRVNEEWSALETLRHLVFVADDWAARTVLAEPEPYWRAGLVPSFLAGLPPERLGIDPSADPDFAEIRDRLTSRMAQIDQLLSGITDDNLSRTCPPSSSFGDSAPVTVLTCVQTVLDEYAAHRRYAERDLDVIVG